MDKTEIEQLDKMIIDKVISDIENFNIKQEQKRQYMKEYYEKNKDRIKQQQKASNTNRRKQLIKEKYNTKQYVRIPRSKILKYGFHMAHDASIIF